MSMDDSIQRSETKLSKSIRSPNDKYIKNIVEKSLSSLKNLNPLQSSEYNSSIHPSPMFSSTINSPIPMSIK